MQSVNRWTKPKPERDLARTPIQKKNRALAKLSREYDDIEVRLQEELLFFLSRK
jgi:hypothetical protein